MARTELSGFCSQESVTPSRQRGAIPSRRRGSYRSGMILGCSGTDSSEPIVVVSRPPLLCLAPGAALAAVQTARTAGPSEISDASRNSPCCGSPSEISDAPRNSPDCGAGPSEISDAPPARHLQRSRKLVLPARLRTHAQSFVRGEFSGGNERPWAGEQRAWGRDEDPRTKFCARRVFGRERAAVGGRAESLRAR